MDRYVPETSLQKLEKMPTTLDIQSLIGTYEPSRRCETTFLRLSKLFQQITVTANLKNHILSIPSFKGLNGQPLRFQEIAHLVFREVNGKAKIAFSNDENGRRIAHINFDTHYPSVIFQQVNNMLDKQGFNYFVLGFSFSMILLTLLAWSRATLAIYLVCLRIVVYAVGLRIFASMLNDFSMLYKE